jgi:endonuclease/exonuclease/phosphatase family metal-dependent hydrolase
MLRVVSLNTASLIEPGWPERRHEIVAWLDQLEADIVCLQEVWESPDSQNTAEWLAQASSTEWHTAFGGLPFPEALWPDRSLLFGSAILSRWPIDSQELVPLPIDIEPASKNPVFGLELELLHARTRGFDVFSTHLAPPPEQAYHRVRQVVFIDGEIKSRASKESPLPPILCGDFNAEPLSDEIRFLSSLATIDGRSTYFQDAWRAAGNLDPGLTWDGRVNRLARSMHLPPKRLDYIFVGDPFGRQDGAGLVESASLAFHEALTGCHASDHFGVQADIRWPARESPPHVRPSVS